MRIRNQVGDRLPMDEHLLEYGPMLLGGSNDSCTGLVKPTLHPLKGLFKGKGVFENTWIRPDPNECRQNRPTQADRVTLGKLVIPPEASLLVRWR